MNVQSGPGGSTVVCPKPGCATVSPAGTRFCPACGTPLGADGVDVPPPPPPPRPDLFAQAGLLAASGGLDRRFEVPRPAEAVRAAILAHLSRGGYEPAEAAVPGSIRAVHKYKHWTTIGMGLRYRLDVRVSDAGAGRSVVDLHVVLDEGVLMRYLTTTISCTLVLGLLSGGIILIVGLIGLPLDYQNVTKKIPAKIADRVAKEIGAATPAFAGQAASPQPSFAPPPPFAPAPPAPPPAPVPAAAGGHTIMEQIGMLAGLRDKGAITDAEFETKKADLLARL